MKKHWILLAILTLGLLFGTAFAGNSENRNRNRQGRRTYRPLPPPSIAVCFEEAGVTQDQIDAMDEIRQLAVEALKEAETREEARDIIEQMREDMKSILTEEQLAAIAECRRPQMPLTCMDQLDLTQDQIEAIDAIREAAMEALKEAETPQEARDIIEQMHQDIESVLTEEQLAALKECLRPKKLINCMDKIDLTPEQIALIDAIREIAMEDVKEAESREEVRQILDQMYQDIMDVLTDEQLEALQGCRDAQRLRLRDRDRQEQPEPEPEV